MHRAPHPRDLSVIHAVRRYIRLQGPFDVIHGHSSKGGAIARIAAIGTGASVVYTPHGLVTMDPGLGRAGIMFYGACERVLSWASGAIIAVAESERQSIAQIGISKRIVHVIHNCIDPPQFLSREEARARLHLHPRATIVGFVGRMSRIKDPLLLISAFDHLHSVHPEVMLAMIGEGELLDEVRAEVDRRGLKEHVHLLGAHPAAELMRAFDILALPSRSEAMSYVLLEALSAGLPVVTTLVSSAEPLVQDDVNGYVVKERTASALGSKLAMLVEDHDRRRRFGGHSLALAKRFTLQKMVNRTMSVYGACQQLREFDSRRQ